MMPLFSDTQKTSTLASLFGLIFILFGWFVLSLALSGLFLFPLIVSGAILSAIIAIFIGWRLFLRAPVEFKSMLLILVVCSALLGYISEPTLFSGRDQGSISEAAFRLAQNGQLAFATDASTAFFNLYGEGTALNFPGFAYTQACDLL
ncbi:MAG TPA: hypothetical protein VJH89_00170, partial [Patescibacteria group bacterium]|nr:hypothetical protein [Patescibacteria group bacterium]